MAVFRLERTRDYTVMSNHHLRDKRLSLKAKGLLSQMLSLPDDWDYTLSGLAYINRESKDAIRSAVNELERAGYVQRHQTTDASGKFSVNEYIIYERPISANPSPEKPSSDIPAPGKPLQDNYVQWNYSTLDGYNALLALNDQTGLIFVENGGRFISIIIDEVPDSNMVFTGLPNDKQFLEMVCDSFAFSEFSNE